MLLQCNQVKLAGSGSQPKAPLGRAAGTTLPKVGLLLSGVRSIWIRLSETTYLLYALRLA